MSLPPEQLVRLKTTPNTEILPEQKILDLLANNEGDVDLTIADCLEYIAARNPWKRVTRGAITVEENTAMARAEVYRRRAALSDSLASERGRIEQGTLTRTDYGPAEEVEYA